MQIAGSSFAPPAEISQFVFVPTDDGVAPAEATECLSATAAVMRVEALSREAGHVGALAFSRKGDSSSGDFGDAEAIRRFGEVPDDLSAL
ncbi:hypothetical protein QA641_09750 [Bradyrhizobium sp. CB1650]|uniref:hypothetical protein n=1 Tax=Bradyrhizobium sp. CB1650 TaxID=3039153 RepID=UPI002435CD69|nr:hypothetical protein [Bradyrhizobium sp. CB1650]WGD54146.1 hypothetical protein QA641_09750 [Bradyrhizobium sp. CB1650]